MSELKGPAQFRAFCKTTDFDRHHISDGQPEGELSARRNAGAHRADLKRKADCISSRFWDKGIETTSPPTALPSPVSPPLLPPPGPSPPPPSLLLSHPLPLSFFPIYPSPPNSGRGASVRAGPRACTAAVHGWSAGDQPWCERRVPSLSGRDRLRLARARAGPASRDRPLHVIVCRQLHVYLPGLRLLSRPGGRLVNLNCLCSIDKFSLIQHQSPGFGLQQTQQTQQRSQACYTTCYLLHHISECQIGSLLASEKQTDFFCIRPSSMKE